jgi:FkbH-like protein
VLPELQTLPFPSDASGWPAFCRSLQELTATSDATLTDEDRDRARLYALRYRSEVARASARSFEDFLASLDMRLEVEPARSPAAASRAQQLLNRANRFHLTGHRYDEGSWAQLVADGRDAFTARLVDGYGDHGICAVVVAEPGDRSTSVVELAMSCRVLNRTLDAALLDWLAKRSGGALTAAFRRTGRNDAVLEALLDEGFSVVTDDGETVLLRLADRERLDSMARYMKVVSTDT